MQSSMIILISLISQLKELVGKNAENLIMGGKDTCQGDSGGPLWVVEKGVGNNINQRISFQAIASN